MSSTINEIVLLRELYKTTGKSEEEVDELLKQHAVESKVNAEKRIKEKEERKLLKSERKARVLAGTATEEDHKAIAREKKGKEVKNRDKNIANMAQKLFSMRFDDEHGVSNYFLNEFMNAYVAETFPLFIDWFEFIWENQKEKKRSYGDIDYSLTKLFDGEYVGEPHPKIPGFTPKKHLRVLYFDDHVTCGEYDKFLIIQETPSGLKMPRYHIRIVYDPSDYKKGVKYVNNPNLKWYQDRKFNLDYVESLHTTPLGGSYADTRDKGYVLTMKGDYSGGWESEGNVMPNYRLYEHICANLDAACYELKEEMRLLEPKADDEN